MHVIGKLKERTKATNILMMASLNSRNTYVTIGVNINLKLNKMKNNDLTPNQRFLMGFATTFIIGMFIFMVYIVLDIAGQYAEL